MTQKTGLHIQTPETITAMHRKHGKKGLMCQMSYSDVRLSFSYQCKIQKSRQIILNTVLLIILGLRIIKLKYNMIIYKNKITMYN